VAGRMFAQPNAELAQPLRLGGKAGGQQGALLRQRFRRNRFGEHPESNAVSDGGHRMGRRADERFEENGFGVLLEQLEIRLSLPGVVHVGRCSHHHRLRRWHHRVCARALVVSVKAGLRDHSISIMVSGSFATLVIQEMPNVIDLSAVPH
jgi:hypothetical protein